MPRCPLCQHQQACLMRVPKRPVPPMRAGVPVHARVAQQAHADHALPALPVPFAGLAGAPAAALLLCRALALVEPAPALGPRPLRPAHPGPGRQARRCRRRYACVRCAGRRCDPGSRQPVQASTALVGRGCTTQIHPTAPWAVKTSTASCCSLSAAEACNSPLRLPLACLQRVRRCRPLLHHPGQLAGGCAVCRGRPAGDGLCRLPQARRRRVGARWLQNRQAAVCRCLPRAQG